MTVLPLEEPETEAHPDPEDVEPEQVDHTTPPGDGLPTNVTTFSWQGRGELGDVAVEFTIDFGPDNQCALTHAARGYTPENSIYNAVVYEGDEPWWYMASDVVVAHGRVGKADTDDVLTVVPYHDGLRSYDYNTYYSHKVPLQDVVRITHLGNGVGANESGTLTGPTLSIDVTCDHPFDIQSAGLGRDVFLRDVQAMEGGAAAHAVLTAHTSIGSTATVDLSGEHVRVVAVRGYAEASQVTVQGPSWETSWLMTPGDWSRVDVLESEPGQHTITVDRVNAGYGAFFLAAYGLQEKLDLDQSQ